MGRDIAGEREMRRTHGRRMSGLEALVVEGGQRRLLLLPPSHFVVHPNAEVLPALLFSFYVPFPRPSQGLDPVRQLPSSSDAHGGLENSDGSGTSRTDLYYFNFREKRDMS